MRQILLRHGEDGFWVAEALSLPGCVTQGRTREEAATNCLEAIEAWIEGARSGGLPVPDDDLSAAVVLVATTAD